jgi:hypothetical protein
VQLLLYLLLPLHLLHLLLQKNNLKGFIFIAP